MTAHRPFIHHRHLSYRLIFFCLLLELSLNAAAWFSASTFRVALSRHSQVLFSTRTLNNNDELNNEDEEDDILVGSPEELRQALREMSRIPKRQSSIEVAYSIPNLEEITDSNTDSMKPTSIRKEYPEYPGRVTNDTGVVEQEHGPTADGWFLDEDDYIHSHNHLNPDGSLSLDDITSSNAAMNTSVDKDYQKLSEKLLQMQSPNVPASFLSSSQNDSENDNDVEPTLETLLQQRLQDPSATSEELHQQVFAREEGYLNQSRVFLESLGSSDESSQAALEAARLRRGANYRKRQDEAISKLNAEIANFEADFLNKQEFFQNSNTQEKCFKCGCALSPQELQQFRAKRDAQASKRLCSVCYGELLVANSDKSFFRDDVIAFSRNNRSFRKGRERWQTNVNTSGQATPNRKRDTARRSPTRRQSISPPIPRPRKPTVSRPTLGQSTTTTTTTPGTPDGNGDDDVESLKEEVKALQDKLRQINNNDDSAIAPEDDEKKESPGDNMGLWTQVVDPDTGDVFYWNEDTEEMKWEL
jgi:hypothetical protein